MTRRLTGLVDKWNEDRGFGFIKTNTYENIFFHISEWQTHDRPKVGDEVFFVLTKENKGLKGIEVRKKDSAIEVFAKFRLGVIWYGVLLMLIGFSRLPAWVLLAYFVADILSYLMYALDKKRAYTNQWRIPENHLHILSLMGGWNGARIAQQKLRHKTQKQPFRFLYFLTILINILTVFAYVFYKPDLGRFF